MSALPALVIATAIFMILIVGVIVFAIAMIADHPRDRAILLVGAGVLAAIAILATIGGLQ